MNEEEAKEIIDMIEAVEVRSMPEGAPAVWAEILSDVSLEDAHARAVAHYRKNDTPLMPVHLTMMDWSPNRAVLERFADPDKEEPSWPTSGQDRMQRDREAQEAVDRLGLDPSDSLKDI